MVMEYLKGQTLAELLKQKQGKLSEAKALEHITKVGEALEILHQAQFLHRDIKPDNIMLVDDGRVVLIDFGAARDFTTTSTARHTTMLTPGYAPLEQYGRALKYGAFTDIYALASTLYHLLTGQAPVSAIERAAGVELKSVKELAPHVSLQVSEAIAKAMVMDVTARVQSVREFFDLLHQDLDQFAASGSVKQLTSVKSFYSSAQDDVWDVFGKTTAANVAKSSPRPQQTTWF
jgi:serine/threonine-protein kinase